MAIQGYLEAISENEVAGWAFDSNEPHRSLIVDVIVEGRIAASGMADRFRSDLRDAGIGSGNHHFVIPVKLDGAIPSCEAGGHLLQQPNSPTDERAHKAGDFWDSIPHVIAQMAPRARFPESPRIMREVNSRICGREVDGFNQGVIEFFRDRTGGSWPLGRAISIGCGPGLKEMALIKEGAVSHFDLFDVSLQSLESGRIYARDNGLIDQVSFIHGYDYQKSLQSKYDLVYWDSALHHMFDAEAAVRWSYEALKPGAWFLMSDFVGANRFQWSPDVYDMVDLIRGSLPEHCFANPVNPAAPFAPKPHRVTLQDMEYDPSEAADSEAILPAVRKYFPDALIKMVGGTVYHMALNDVLTNIPEDSELLGYLLTLDRNIDIPHFAVAIAQKPI